MPAEFHDRHDCVVHSQFQGWRRRYPAGFFLTFGAKSRARLHMSLCPHAGDVDWRFEDTAQSLTRNERSATRPRLPFWNGLLTTVFLFHAVPTAFGPHLGPVSADGRPPRQRQLNTYRHRPTCLDLRSLSPGDTGVGATPCRDFSKRPTRWNRAGGSTRPCSSISGSNAASEQPGSMARHSKPSLDPIGIAGSMAWATPVSPAAKRASRLTARTMLIACLTLCRNRWWQDVVSCSIALVQLTGTRCAIDMKSQNCFCRLPARVV